jgi:methionine-rich copper-binding protein CopC
MAAADQENNDLREEVVTLKEGMEKITAILATTMAAQAQASQAQAAQAQVTVSQPAGTYLAQPIPTAIHVSATPAVTLQPVLTEVTSRDMTNMFNGGSRPGGSFEFTFAPQYFMPKVYP